MNNEVKEKIVKFFEENRMQYFAGSKTKKKLDSKEVKEAIDSYEVRYVLDIQKDEIWVTIWSAYLIFTFTQQGDYCKTRMTTAIFSSGSDVLTAVLNIK